MPKRKKLATVFQVVWGHLSAISESSTPALLLDLWV